jgi:hypothetical protein
VGRFLTGARPANKEITMLIRTGRVELEVGLLMIYVRLGRWDWYWNALDTRWGKAL